MTLRSAIFRQLGQNVVLHTISKGRLLFLLAQIFKRQNGDASCWRLPDQVTLPNDPASQLLLARSGTL